MDFTHQDRRHDKQARRSSSELEPTPGKAPLYVQRKELPGQPTVDARPAIEGAAAGPGSALPDQLAARFGDSLGRDLGGVRIHADSSAAIAAESIGARAFTVGNDIYFGAGYYDPASREGQTLLAHEVAHTVQQGSAPAVQSKMKVSAPGDAAEREADAVGGRMVSGQPATVTERAVGIHRDPVQGSDIVIRNETLPDEISRSQDEAVAGMDRSTQWGTGQTTDIARGPDGQIIEARPRNSELMRNARGQGAEADLMALSAELDQVKPLLRAWMSSQSAVVTIAQGQGLNVDTPGAYEREVRTTIGRQMQNTRDQTGGAMRETLQGASGTGTRAATEKLSSCITRLQNAQRALVRWKGSLERARLQREVQENQAQLTAINEKIQMISTVITTVASVVASVSGVAATASASLSGALLNPPETFGSAAPGAVTGGGAAAVQSRAGQVAGAGNVIESALRYTVFAGDIDRLNGRIAALNSQIGALQLRDVVLQTEEVGAALTAAKTDYQEASHAAADSQQNFFNAMRMAGRTYDQQGMSRRAADAIQGASVRDGNTVSMEALFTLVASLQARQSARTAFGALAAGSSKLRQAEAIVAQALSNPRAGFVTLTDGSRVLGRPDIDVSQPENGWDPSLALRIEGASLRSTVANVAQALQIYNDQHESQSALENAWMAMVNRATSRIVH